MHSKGNRLSYLFLTLDGAIEWRSRQPLKGCSTNIKRTISSFIIRWQCKTLVTPELKSKWSSTALHHHRRPKTTVMRWVKWPYPDSSPYWSDDELPSWFCSGLSVHLRLLLRTEGVGELYVSLIQCDLLPFEVGFLIQHPSKRRRGEENLVFPFVFWAYISSLIWELSPSWGVNQSLI